MSSATPQILIEESKKIGQQSASQTLKAIARAYPGKLFCTLSLVALENALLLAYPLFAGFAVDSIIRGDAGSALFYAAVVLAFWVVGAARRALDTRTFTRIYADLAVPVILNQRLQNHSTSRAAARVVLARDFVDFFEKHVPIIATALVSIVGAAVMLLVIEPWIGLACLTARGAGATTPDSDAARSARRLFPPGRFPSPGGHSSAHATAGYAGQSVAARWCTTATPSGTPGRSTVRSPTDRKSVV